MNKFEQSELIGRHLFEDVLNSLDITTWKPTENLYDRVDGYFTKDNKLAVVEIKRRDLKYEDYPTHLMEVDKFSALILDAKDKGIKCAYYACFFGDNTLYLYNAAEIKYHSDVDTVLCPKTTSGNPYPVWKKCFLIHTDIASVYKKIDDKWIRLAS